MIFLSQRSSRVLTFPGFQLLVEKLDAEDQLAYLEDVVEPSLPELAVRYQCNIFDIFFSLRVPPGPPEPWQLDVPQQTSSDRGIASLRGHQMEYQRSMREAFHTALQFRMQMAKSDPEDQFTASFVHVGEEFDEAWMKVASSQVSDHDLTADHSVLLCLCPGINRTTGSFGNRRTDCILKALVMVEGFSIDEELDGYPCYRPIV